MSKQDLTIVVPLAGAGTSYSNAGYTFPKPLIDVNGMPMIEAVLRNLKLKKKCKYIFLCRREHIEKYPLQKIFNNIVGEKYEIIQIVNQPKGAACTILTAIEQINNDGELIIANADQIIDKKIDDFITYSHKSKTDGVIMTFESNHPRWSYVRLNKQKEVIETAEKKVISNNATVGIYYFRKGRFFVDAALKMIEKDIRTNDEFYVCPVYNELILSGSKVTNWHLNASQMHGLGTPEELNEYLLFFHKKRKIKK